MLRRCRGRIFKPEFVTSPHVNRNGVRNNRRGGGVECGGSAVGSLEERVGDIRVLTGVLCRGGVRRDGPGAGIRARCGWDLEVAADLEELQPATIEELTMLRLFDPQRFFLGKTGEK